MNMKLRYRLFLRRKSVYYAFDDTTKTFTSLKTKDKAEAMWLLVGLNDAGNLRIAPMLFPRNHLVLSTA